MEYVPYNIQMMNLNRYSHNSCLGTTKKKLNIKEAIQLLRQLEIKQIERGLK